MEKVICIICGMNINLNNLNLNEAALLKKNSLEEINSCPFCGASKEFFQTEGIESSNKNILDDKTIKVLDNAMKLEVFNGDFYKQAAILAKEEKNKKIFEALSKIEIMHARVHQRLGGFDKLPVLKKMDYTKYNDDNALFKEASKREEHAVEYYKKYSKAVGDEYISTILNGLSLVEKEHIILTIREINL